MTKSDKYRKVVDDLIETIEATGGVVHTKKGHYEPIGDREWIDLGAIYVRACAAIGRNPRIVQDTDG